MVQKPFAREPSGKLFKGVCIPRPGPSEPNRTWGFVFLTSTADTKDQWKGKWLRTETWPGRPLLQALHSRCIKDVQEPTEPP